MGKSKNSSKRELYEGKAEKLVLPLVQKHNMDLVDVEYVKEGGIYYLRVYIDKEDGITLEDCKKIHNPFSNLLDKEDFIEESYVLEVGSPGLGRPLRKDKDYDRNIDREIEVHTYKMINKEKYFVGLLIAWDDDKIIMLLENGDNIEIERNNIAVIKEYFEF